MVRERGLATDPGWTIPARAEAGPAPLSFGQEQLWFFDQLAPGSSFYNDCYGARFAGNLDAAILQRCLNEIVGRHEILRTAFLCEDGQPVQRVARTIDVTLDRIDLSDQATADRQHAVHHLAADDLRKAFDLTRLPLFRSRLLRLSDDEHVLILVIHHIISDGWSMGVLFRELATLYESISRSKPSPLPRLPIQYSDFVLWQRSRLQGALLATQLAYWKQQLCGCRPELHLPVDHPRPELQRYRGASHDVWLSRSLTQAVQSLSHREAVTPFVTLLAVYTIQLSSYSSQDDILVGTPMSGRTHSGIEHLIGFFVNTVVLRANLSGNPTFRELLARVQAMTVDASSHQDLPFGRLVDELKPDRKLGRNPLFQVWFTLLNAPVPSIELPGLSLSFMDVASQHARMDLALLLWDSADGLRGKLEYDTDLFEASTIEGIARDYQTLLQAAISTPDARLDGLKRTLVDKSKQGRSLDLKRVKRRPVSERTSRTT